MGKVNIDLTNGIRYGVISQHSIMMEVMDNFEYDYGDPCCPKCSNVILDYTEEYNKDDSIGEYNHSSEYDSEDYVCLGCKLIIGSESAYPNEAIGFHYEGEGYQIIDCLDTDLMILKSPYYTLCQFCSPCVPGAGNLDSPIENGIRAYCLGAGWFEDEKAPYPIYNVKTDERV